VHVYVSFWSALRPSALVIPFSYIEFDDALGRAKLEIEQGGDVRKIESDDGFTLKPSQIRKLIRERGSKLLGRPRTY